MRTAMASDVGQTISLHFGRADQYIVVGTDDGRVVSYRLRPKPTPAHLAGELYEHEQEHQHAHNRHHRPGQSHGFGPHEQARHEQMLAPIIDCQVVLSGGMRAPMYHSLQEAGNDPHKLDRRGS